MARINWEHPRVLRYIRDDVSSLEGIVPATERSRRQLLSELVFENLVASEDVEIDAAMVDRYQQVIETHHYDKQWIQGLGEQLQNSSQWRKAARLKGGLLQLAQDLVKSVRKSRGDLSLVGERERISIMAQLALQQLGPQQLTTAVGLTIQQIKAATDFKQIQMILQQRIGQIEKFQNARPSPRWPKSRGPSSALGKMISRPCGI